MRPDKERPTTGTSRQYSSTVGGDQERGAKVETEATKGGSYIYSGRIMYS